MASTDRRHFLPFGQTYFLRLREKTVTSDEVHAFMNEVTGLNVGLDEPNGVAFDKWRQAMKARGYNDAWDVSEDRTQAVKDRGAALLAEEQQRAAAKSITLEDGTTKTLAQMALEAPNVPAGELLRRHEKRIRQALERLRRTT